jgi:hypothetical protein
VGSIPIARSRSIHSDLLTHSHFSRSTVKYRLNALHGLQMVVAQDVSVDLQSGVGVTVTELPLSNSRSSCRANDGRREALPAAPGVQFRLCPGSGA